MPRRANFTRYRDNGLAPAHRLCDRYHARSIPTEGHKKMPWHRNSHTMAMHVKYSNQRFCRRIMLLVVSLPVPHRK